MTAHGGLLLTMVELVTGQGRRWRVATKEGQLGEGEEKAR